MNEDNKDQVFDYKFPAKKRGIIFYDDKYCQLLKGDCLEVIPKKIKDKSVDIIITSPPYNLNIKYNTYKDNLPVEKYLDWFKEVCSLLKKVMKDDGSFFLNFGYSSKDPWIDLKVMLVAGEYFKLQNRFTWVKAISINEKSYGHFNPINSKRYINMTHELLFHFTKEGNVNLNKKAIGVPYVHPSNLTRWSGKKNEPEEEKGIRCRGNSWFIPYTTMKKQDKGDHPAVFPRSLPKWCIKIHGYNPETVVLDPFVGIGTTAIAAREMGTKAVGIDIDENYLREAKKNVKDI